MGINAQIEKSLDKYQLNDVPYSISFSRIPILFCQLAFHSLFPFPFHTIISAQITKLQQPSQIVSRAE